MAECLCFATDNIGVYRVNPECLEHGEQEGFIAVLETRSITIELSPEQIRDFDQIIDIQALLQESKGMTREEMTTQLLNEALDLLYEAKIELLEKMKVWTEEQDDPKLAARRDAMKEKVYDFLFKHIKRVGLKNIRPGSLEHRFVKQVKEIMAQIAEDEDEEEA